MARRVRVPSWNWVFLCVFGLLTWLGGASVRAQSTLHVDTTSDATHGTNDCATGAGSSCSLRDAIGQANSDGSGDTIVFNSGLNGETITLGSALPSITVSVTITGNGANQTTISGAGAYLVFTLNPGSSGTVVIGGLAVVKGNGVDAGAISLGTGTLKVTDCSFSGNTASEYGGAITTFPSTTLTVSGSTFSGNSSPGGGAIDSSGALTVTDSTFSGNSATTGGGAISGGGTSTIVNNTFSANSAHDGGAIYAGGALNAGNNLFSGNTASNSGGAITQGAGTVTADHNVYYNSSPDNCDSCTTNTNAVSASSNPIALPLGNYGGPTETFLPQPGSAAICAGSATLASAASLSIDQRGFAMGPAYSSCASASVDAGAVQSNYIQVQSTGGGTSANGFADCQGTSCTLTDAVSVANLEDGGDIDFASGVTSITQTGGLTLGSTQGVNIVGPGASSLTINGGGSSSNFSVFTVSSGVPVFLYGLTISNGNTAGSGGGINNSGTLTVDQSAISGNVALNGGGIYNSGSGTAYLEDSTLSGNTSLSGGAIFNESGSTMQILESTLSGNSLSASAPGCGGGIANNGTLSITDSTIAGNAETNLTGNGEGGICTFGTLTLANSIVAGNTDASATASNIAGSYTNNGGSVVGGNTDAKNSLVGGTGPGIITLSPLQLNGLGATLQTMIPLPGSAAICAGTTANIPSGTTTDERGYPVENTTYTGYSSGSPCVDAGAVQTNYTSMGFVQGPSDVNVATNMSPVPTVQVLETDTLLASNNTDAVNGVPVTLTAASGTLSGGSATTAGGVATFSSLQVAQPEMSDKLSIQAITVVGTDTLGPVLSGDFDVIGATSQLVVSAPSSATAGSPISVTITAEDSAGNTTTGYLGTVQFSSTDTGAGISLPANYTFVSADNGTHTFTNAVKLVTVGNQTVTATDTSNNSINGTTAAIAVSAASSTVSVVSSTPASPTVDQLLTFTAELSPQTAPFTGTMEFYVGGNPIPGCTAVTINSGTYSATCSPTAGATAGSYNITAQYNAGANDSYNSSSASANFPITVGKAATQVTVTPVSQSSTVDASVTFTATVSPNVTSGFVGNAQVTPMSGGTVTFDDNGTAITGCTAQAITFNAASGTATATCTTSTLPAGSDLITAAYSSGDSNYQASPVSAAATATMAKANTTMALTSSTGGTSNVNQSVTFTATVTPAGASVALGGSVTFVDNGNAISACGTSGVVAVNPSTNVATCSTSVLTGGNHTITATYGSDSNYNSSTTNVAQTVSAIASSVATPVLVSPASPTYGNTVTVSATVSAATETVPFSGTMAFYLDGGAIAGCGAEPVNAASGLAQCQFTAQSVPNTYTITATYSNDPSYNQSTSSGQLSLVIGKATPDISISSTLNPSTVNQPVNFIATVSTTTTPTGTMKFTDNGITIAGCSAVTPSGNIFTCQDTSLTATSGTPHTIVATYSGDSYYLTNNNGLNQTVNQASTTVTVTSSANPSSVNANVTFTATVIPSLSGSVALAGTVTFTDVFTPQGGSPNAPVTLCAATAVTLSGNNGVVTCQSATLGLGSHAITATYASDANFSGNSANLSQGVGAASTSTALASSASSGSTVNQTVTFTATVTTASGPGSLSGTVQFTDNGTSIPNCSAVSPSTTTGVATCADPDLTAGTHIIGAVYAHDTNFGSSNITLTQTVAQEATSVSLGSTAAPSTVNQSVTFTATVTASPSGSIALSSLATVSFSDSVTGTTIPGCAVVPISVNSDTGTAACTTAALTLGSHTITATYANDGNFKNGSATLGQTVNKAATSLAVVSSSPLVGGVPTSAVNQSVTFTATVTYPAGATALSGTVDFVDSVTSLAIPGCSAAPLVVNGGLEQATCTYALLSVGGHTVTATYGNDANFNGSSGAVTQTVQVAALNLTLTSSSPSNTSTVNQPVTFTATIPFSSTPSGTVTFSDSINGTLCSGVHPSPQAGTYTAVCSYAALTAGVHTVTAAYGGDPNFSVSNGTSTQTVNQAASTTTIVSSPNPSYAGEPVTFTAQVSPAGSTIALSGTLTFAGVTCTTQTFSLSTGIATCATTLSGGAYTVNATYQGDTNYASSNTTASPVTQVVGYYTISVQNGSATGLGFQVTKGYTSATDPFPAAQQPDVSPTVLPAANDFNSTGVTLTCTSSASGAPKCNVASPLPVSSASPQTAAITIDATAAAVAPGTYTFTVTANDTATSITASTTFNVTVRPAPVAPVITSGATTGNTASLTFYPTGAGVTLNNFKCQSITGTGITSPEAPSALGMACSFSPSSLTASPYTTTVTITTNGTIAAAKPMDIGNNHSGLLLAGLFTLPIFGLLGIGRGRRSLWAGVFRMVAIVAIGIAALQAMGCGGGFSSSGNSTTSGGTTPPGTYYLQITGTGSDGNTYQTVLQVNVNL